MTRRSVRYAVVDAFTDTPFKGNPAAVCLLEEEAGLNDNWMQNVAKEFNISETAFLLPSNASSKPRFRLRWFTPVAEVKLCGHATLASAHFLFTSGVVKGDVIEFDTLSGILVTKKMQDFGKLGFAEPCSNGNGESFSIELDFPIIQVVDCVSEEMPSFPETLNDLSMVNVQKTSNGDLLDPVCGSAHCALAPYWSRKLGKNNLMAYQASPRCGILDLQVDEERSRVLIRGKAVTVMEGFLMV
ncbi:hypothetical protein KFK09_000375 [Dendrobium nobile]|uniref:Uncharacterized protein n=1 Tax=Dendrobium nobile TaxID=94219 RepID=A0A8T3CCZ5_DENNO|nr:hypothetical protein KFK09_000375 [Dendrobium nobile]